jgi:thymidylate synthase
MEEIPLANANKLTVGRPGEISICTLWTEQKLIQDFCDQNGLDVYIIGNLYTQCGLLRMLVNILRRPIIKKLIVLTDNDSQDSLRALLDVDKTWQTILPPELLESVRASFRLYPTAFVNLIETYKVATLDELPNRPAVDLGHLLVTTPKLGGWSRRPAYNICAYNMDEAYERMIELIYTRGARALARDNSILELQNLSICLPATETVETIYKYILSSNLYYNFTKEQLDKYLESFVNETCPAGLAYTYRSRIDLTKLLPFIRADSKQAWYPIFTKDDYVLDEKPCCVGIEFLVFEDLLNLTVIFRSHDMLRGWPLNVLGFKSLQQQTAAITKLKVGTLTTFSISAHIYTDSLTTYDLKFRPPAYDDPEGYYTIEKIDDNIVVQHFNPQGVIVYEWTRILSEWEDLIVQIAQYTAEPSHAAWVAKEITKLACST